MTDYSRVYNKGTVNQSKFPVILLSIKPQFMNYSAQGINELDHFECLDWFMHPHSEK